MQTNGITKITVKGVIYPLLFGRAAVEEMGNRTANGGLIANRVKMLTDLVYSGLANKAIADEREIPEYSFAYNLVDQLIDEDDSTQQQEKIWEVFETSRHGKEWISQLEDAKKKIDAEMRKMDKMEMKMKKKQKA